jgi:glycerate kinase
MVTPQRLFVAGGSFGPDLPAPKVVAAIARGLQAGGLPEPDLLPLPDAKEHAGDVRELLEAVGFDTRMRRARAVIVGAERLREETLVGSATFEIATRARQAGVPAYAVTAENCLAPFDARILDLQVVLEARTARQLSAAGRRLASLG